MPDWRMHCIRPCLQPAASQVEQLSFIGDIGVEGGQVSVSVSRAPECGCVLRWPCMRAVLRLSEQPHGAG